MGQQHILSPQRDDFSLLAGYSALVVTDESGTHRLKVHVSGIHCVGCIAKVEGCVHALNKSVEARLNVTNSELRLAWTEGGTAFAEKAMQALQEAGYQVRPVVEDTSNSELKSLLMCLAVSGFAMGNVMLISIGLWITNAETMGSQMRMFLHLISALIALPTLLYAGRPFYMSAITALRHGRTNMDIPISVGLFLTVGMSVFETFAGGEHVYFDSAVMLMFFLLLGRVLDMKTKYAARKEVQNLEDMMAGFARVVEAGGISSVPLKQVVKGQIVRVPMGEVFPLDGELIGEAKEVDTSLVTGESVPVPFEKGSKIYGGMVNLSQSVDVRVSHAYNAGVLHDIQALLEESSTVRSRYTRLADKVSRAYTPVVHALALFAFVFWLMLSAPWQQSLLIGVTVLIITCPCALGLAVPVVHVRAVGALMKRGIYMKQGDALERLSHIDTILFDKTGTLTKPVLTSQLSSAELVLFASVAAHSRHPLSVAFVESCAAPLKRAVDVQEVPGQGVRAIVDGKCVQIGQHAFVGGQGNKSGMWMRIDKEEPLEAIFSEGLLPCVEEDMQALKAQGFCLVLVTGDKKRAADKLQQLLNFDAVYAAQSPTDKVARLKSYQDKGAKVLMVGDGLNDAGILNHADASLAPSSASELARTQADGVYVTQGIGAVRDVLRVAVRSQMLIRQNITLSVVYNVVAVPIAFAGLITPLIAALSMSASSLVVTLNALRLK